MSLAPRGEDGSLAGQLQSFVRQLPGLDGDVADGRRQIVFRDEIARHPRPPLEKR